MIKKNTIGVILFMGSNFICLSNVLKIYHEASIIIMNKILKNEDLLYFSKNFYIKDITCFFENIILAAYALTNKDKNMLNMAFSNFEMLFADPPLLKECLNSFCILFGHKKYAKHLSLTAIRNHSKEITIFICVCKKMVEWMPLDLSKNVITIIENYEKDIEISKVFTKI